jgi:hypothetical protein
MRSIDRRGNMVKGFAGAIYLGKGKDTSNKVARRSQDVACRCGHKQSLHWKLGLKYFSCSGCSNCSEFRSESLSEEME